MIEEVSGRAGDKCIDPGDLMAQVPRSRQKGVVETLAERIFGFGKCAAAGGSLPTQQTYEQLDHQIMGWATVGDAVLVAGETMLELKSGDTDVARPRGRTAAVQSRVQYLLRFFGGRIRRVISPDYPSLGVLIELRIAWLRRFIAANREDVVR